jgi:hypothetical protein
MALQNDPNNSPAELPVLTTHDGAGITAAWSGCVKLGLALYRMVFGQPRQEDLLSSINQNGSHESVDLIDWLISLQPPTLP